MDMSRFYMGSDGQSHMEAQHLRDIYRLVCGTVPAIRYDSLQHIGNRPGNGMVRRFGAGDARLVEDTTGKEHMTRTGGAPQC
jgi:hypothetical protein